MRTALVAGGAGFIGSHLCNRLLKDEYHVISVDNLITGHLDNLKLLKDNSAFTFLNHDITQRLPSEVKADFVFHLASPASPNHHSPKSYHALAYETMIVNTLGTLRLLEFSQKNSARFLFGSTSEVYGDPLEHPQKEEYRGNVSTTGPRSVYDESKRFGETLTAYFWREKGLNGRIARIFNTFGPNMQKEDGRMIISFINQAISDNPITVFGDGEQTRSLCFIDDLIEGLVRLMFYDNTDKTIINLGSSEEHTVNEYAKMIKKLTNSKSVIVSSEELPLDDPKKRRPDISKAWECLNWKPQITLEEGLKKTIQHFKTL